MGEFTVMEKFVCLHSFVRIRRAMGLKSLLLVLEQPAI